MESKVLPLGTSNAMFCEYSYCENTLPVRAGSSLMGHM